MKTGYIIITAAVISALVLIVPIRVIAASENDMNGPSIKQQPIQTGRTEAVAGSTVTPNAGAPMVVTAMTSKTQARPGDSVGLIVTAHTPNGTAINNATMKAFIINYINSTNKINLSTVTDKTGDGSFKFKIAKDAGTAQWLINVQANKPGFRQADISTGIAVTSFSGHDFSSGKTKCSGSSCK